MKQPKEYRPRRKRVLPRVPRKRKRVFPRIMKFPMRVYGSDIDLTKPENLSGGFCTCGGRQSDGVCQRCLYNETAGESLC